MADRPPRACIDVLAGVDGAGKSSIAGESLRARAAEYFNPDEYTRSIRSADPRVSESAANEVAWLEGKRRLEESIRRRRDFVFETTLGGRTITRLLEEALDDDIDVRVWYVGLRSAALHIARVRARVARGGHDIPEEKIRERYDSSRANLIRLLPRLTVLQVYDNSAEAEPATGNAPEPLLVLHTERGRIRSRCPNEATPDWAKPIVMAALHLDPAGLKATPARPTKLRPKRPRRPPK